MIFAVFRPWALLKVESGSQLAGPISGSPKWKLRTQVCLRVQPASSTISSTLRLNTDSAVVFTYSHRDTVSN